MMRMTRSRAGPVCLHVLIQRYKEKKLREHLYNFVVVDRSDLLNRLTPITKPYSTFDFL